MNLNGPIAINGPGAIDLIWSELAEARGVAKRSFSWLFPVCSWITHQPEVIRWKSLSTIPIGSLANARNFDLSVKAIP